MARVLGSAIMLILNHNASVRYLGNMTLAYSLTSTNQAAYSRLPWAGAMTKYLGNILQLYSLSICCGSGGYHA
jgi:hypothetical protein